MAASAMRGYRRSWLGRCAIRSVRQALRPDRSRHGLDAAQFFLIAPQYRDGVPELRLGALPGARRRLRLVADLRPARRALDRQFSYGILLDRGPHPSTRFQQQLLAQCRTAQRHRDRQGVLQKQRCARIRGRCGAHHFYFSDSGSFALYWRARRCRHRPKPRVNLAGDPALGPAPAHPSQCGRRCSARPRHLARRRALGGALSARCPVPRYDVRQSPSLRQPTGERQFPQRYDARRDESRYGCGADFGRFSIGRQKGCRYLRWSRRRYLAPRRTGKPSRKRHSTASGGQCRGAPRGRPLGGRGR